MRLPDSQTLSFLDSQILRLSDSQTPRLPGSQTLRLFDRQTLRLSRISSSWEYHNCQNVQNAWGYLPVPGLHVMMFLDLIGLGCGVWEQQSDGSRPAPLNGVKSNDRFSRSSRCGLVSEISHNPEKNTFVMKFGPGDPN